MFAANQKLYLAARFLKKLPLSLSVCLLCSAGLSCAAHSESDRREGVTRTHSLKDWRWRSCWWISAIQTLLHKPAQLCRNSEIDLVSPLHQ